VTYIHRCGFCGWSREASSEVIIAPRCAACGCMLESRTAAVQHTSEDGPVQASWFAKPLAVLVAATLLVAAGRAGYATGSVPGAVVAAALMAFLLLPFARRSPNQGSSRFTASGENAGRQTEM
jgi:hypothetical protein